MFSLPAMMGLSSNESWTILAVFIGPIAAVQAQKWIERAKERRSRQRAVFETLMATRAHTLSWRHVEALNQIDFVFDGNNKLEAEVRDSREKYLDHHTLPAADAQGEVNTQWLTKREDMLVTLLFKMSRVVGPTFTELQIRRSVYNPVVHWKTEHEMVELRTLALEVLNEKRALRVRFEIPEDAQKQRGELQPDAGAAGNATKT
jgi:hypothetical protein